MADDRFTNGLLHDVLTVLHRHGYHPPTDTAGKYRALAHGLEATHELCRAYEGHGQCLEVRP